MSVRTPDPDWHSGEPDENSDALGDQLSGAFGDSRSGIPPDSHGWLTDLELDEYRRKLPILYVEAIPVRIDNFGQVTEVGLLLRGSKFGEISRSIISGRVLFGESLRNALVRHLEKDLGPMAFPQLPATMVPFAVAEYFPVPGLSVFTDPRQHAVSLAYVVPVTGTCEPRQDALEVTWMTPEEVVSSAVATELSGGRGTLVWQALASVGALPLI